MFRLPCFQAKLFLAFEKKIIWFLHCCDYLQLWPRDCNTSHWHYVSNHSFSQSRFSNDIFAGLKCVPHILTLLQNTKKACVAVHAAMCNRNSLHPFCMKVFQKSLWLQISYLFKPTQHAGFSSLSLLKHILFWKTSTQRPLHL